MSSLSPLNNGSLKDKRVGVCVSGGLDTKSVCKRLVEAGLDVLAFSADLGKNEAAHADGYFWKIIMQELRLKHKKGCQAELTYKT